ncbi:MAG: molybdenum cofactor guanylyltransferase [Deltaproteobacteria bacterium]|nr:molybdenum cofactor guanylyltransferase [Deltaproteobacteria bacterium]
MPNEERIPNEKHHDVAGVILAGGRSSRFGENKALAVVKGETLIERVVRTLDTLFDSCLIVTNEPHVFSFLGLPAVEDMVKGLGPLGGIHTALKTIQEPYAFVVACDMPELNPRLVRLLVGLRHEYDVVVPRIDGWLEALHAVYSKRCLKAVESVITSGFRQVIRFFPEVRVRYVDRKEVEEADPALESFFNINTRDDLRRFLSGGRAHLKGPKS